MGPPLDSQPGPSLPDPPCSPPAGLFGTGIRSYFTFLRFLLLLNLLSLLLTASFVLLPLAWLRPPDPGPALNLSECATHQGKCSSAHLRHEGLAQGPERGDNPGRGPAVPAPGLSLPDSALCGAHLWHILSPLLRPPQGWGLRSSSRRTSPMPWGSLSIDLLPPQQPSSALAAASPSLAF